MPWSARGPLERHAEERLDLVDLGSELAVELVAADPRQVVALVGEERALEVLARRLDGLDLTGARALVDLEQRRVLGRDERLLLRPLRLEEVEVVDEAL